jgi:hypothetical protein
MKKPVNILRGYRNIKTVKNIKMNAEILKILRWGIKSDTQKKEKKNASENNVLNANSLPKAQHKTHAGSEYA